MNKERYLQRIGYYYIASRTDKVLHTLHKLHVLHVPFENLDIHYKQVFDLKIANVYRKVVRDFRGGFCYELNLLFNWLLNELGFSSRIIASRIFNQEGNIGPPFDHMSIYVKTEREFLVDVGYGDLFLTPIEIKSGIQSDGRSFFTIEQLNEQEYLLSNSEDGGHFKNRYTFNLGEVKPGDFDNICFEKQTSPESFFVKNLICTKAKETGRVTILNNRLIEKNGEMRDETLIQNVSELTKYLWSEFGIVIRERKANL